MRLLRITTPSAVCGVVIVHGSVRYVAPYMRFMHRWPEEKVFDHCRRKNWQVEDVETDDAIACSPSPMP